MIKKNYVVSLCSVALMSATVLTGCSKSDDKPTTPDTDTAVNTPTAPAETSQTTPMGAGACEQIKKNPTDPRPPMLIANGKSEVDEINTQITLTLTAPFSKKPFQQGVGDAVLNEYGFKITAKDGSIYSYSLKDDTAEVYGTDGYPLEKQPNTSIEYEGSQVVITIPTKEMNFDTRDWTAQLLVVSSGGVQKTSNCVAGTSSYKFVQLNEPMDTATTSK